MASTVPNYTYLSYPIPPPIQVGGTDISPDLSTFKNNNSAYTVTATNTGSPSISTQMVPDLIGYQYNIDVVTANGGTIVLPNPPLSGLYTIQMDFGVALGSVNISTIAYLSAASSVWSGGAEFAILSGNPALNISIGPLVGTSASMVIVNNSGGSLPIGSVNFTLLGQLP